jgi:hypothetical protein
LIGAAYSVKLIGVKRATEVGKAAQSCVISEDFCPARCKLLKRTLGPKAFAVTAVGITVTPDVGKILDLRGDPYVVED